MKPTYHFKSKSTYRFKRRLGAGGSADALLYSREIPGLPSQDVVLKVIKNSKEDALEELINDGKRLSQLRHPHIVAMFGFEKIGEEAFGLLLEYVAGSDLRRLIAHIPESQRSPIAAYVVLKISEAMAFAHEHEIIHGDISARNILVSQEGQVKLSDFGLAIKSQKTPMQRRAKGSVDYWSPERWEGHEPSMAGDVFALGLVAFEMLWGANPFHGLGVDRTRQGLKAFLDAKNWEIFAPWQAFFDGVFAIDPQLRPSSLELGNLLPPLEILPLEQQKNLAACFGGFFSSEISSKTMTVMLEGFFKKVSKGLWCFLASGVFILAGLLPLATGVDHKAEGRLRPYALTITSEPWGEIFIDGRSVGYTPILNLSLSSGAHSLLWRDYGKNEVRKTIMAFDNGLVFLRIR